MKKIKLLLIFLGISLPSLIIAQDRVFIPDTAFGSFLCEEFPSEMSINCDSINYGSESITGDLIILGRGIYDLTGIKAFTKINKLFIGNTSITTVPRLPESPNLTLVNILRGQVNDFEDGFIPIDNNLDVLNFNTNNISQIPDLANASSTLTRLFINENKLKTLPS